MARFNTRFNYETQIQGETIWERIKTLDGFLNGRLRALDTKEQDRLEYEALQEELKSLEDNNSPSFEIKRTKAKLLAQNSVREQLAHDFALCEAEIKDIQDIRNKLLKEAEPTRLKHQDGTPYTNEEMFEANCEFEFVARVAKDIQADILALGRPSSMHIRQAMSCKMGIALLKSIPHLIPQGFNMLEGIYINPKEILLEYKNEMQ